MLYAICLSETIRHEIEAKHQDVIPLILNTVPVVIRLIIIDYLNYVYVSIQAKTRFCAYLVKIELLQMVHYLCERHHLVQGKFPFPFLLQDIEV